jgi:AraC-like DNA-binding protein
MIVDIPAGPHGLHQSYILSERASRFEAGGIGWLSIKRFFGGAAIYRVGAAAYRVDDQRYLVLNHGQRYSITIDARRPVESLCVFVAPGLAEHVLASLQLGADALLDDPHASRAPAWVERTYPSANRVGLMIASLRQALAARTAEPAWLAEWQLQLVGAALETQQQSLLAASGALLDMRPATRHELYRRLYLARDYAEAQLHEPLTIADLAHVAGLSPNHLLRTYRQLFGLTPYQHLIHMRLERAKELLLNSDAPVTEVGTAVGFERPSAFSWLFQRRFGLSPRQYRSRSR